MQGSLTEQISSPWRDKKISTPQDFSAFLALCIRSRRRCYPRGLSSRQMHCTGLFSCQSKKAPGKALRGFKSFPPASSKFLCPSRGIGASLQKGFRAFRLCNPSGGTITRSLPQTSSTAICFSSAPLVSRRRYLEKRGRIRPKKRIASAIKSGSICLFSKGL